MSHNVDRKRMKKDFLEVYEQLCAVHDCCPLRAITDRLRDSLIDCHADRIQYEEWGPILNALKCKNSLRLIAFRSFWQPSRELKGEVSQRVSQRRKALPAVFSRDIMERMCGSLQELLTSSNYIGCLILQGIPFRENDMHILAKGILKNSTLQAISLESSRIGDEGLGALSVGLKHLVHLKSLCLCDCGITWRGMNTIRDLIKHQAIRRHGEAWQESLRYRTPDLNSMYGLRRIDLCRNTMIGDRGAMILGETLKDDLWVKAIDLQQCGISSDGANSLLSALDYNTSLSVLDVRSNPLLEQGKIRAILEKVMINTGGEDPEYPWKSVKNLKDIKKSPSFKKPIKFTLHAPPSNSRFSCKKKRKSHKHDINSETANKPLASHCACDRIKSVTTRSVEKPLNHQSFYGNKKNSKARSAARYYQSIDDRRNPKSIDDRRNPKSIDDRRNPTQAFQPIAQNGASCFWNEHVYCDSQNVLNKGSISRSMKDSGKGVKVNVKDVKVRLKTLEMKYKNEMRERANAELRQKELEIENQKLKDELLLLKSRVASPPTESRSHHFQSDSLEDGKVLESVEASFEQFQRFLDQLSNTDVTDLFKLVMKTQ